MSLLYADDLVLISNNAEGLQHKLEILHQYCRDWCLKDNIKKTKVVIFNQTGRLITENFTLGSEAIECVNRYKYLGIMLLASGTFKEARHVLYNKALKVCFNLYKDLKSTDPPIKTFLHLFDHMVKPIVLYGEEIWGLLTTSTLRKDIEI